MLLLIKVHHTDLKILFSPSEPRSEYTETHINVDVAKPFTSPVDVAERQFRQRLHPQYESTVDAAATTCHRHHQHTGNTYVNEFTVDNRVPSGPKYNHNVKVSQDTVEPIRYSRADQKARMGYYDEDGKFVSSPIIQALKC